LKQKTTTDWNCTRLENGSLPSLAVEPFSKVSHVMKHDHHYDLIIFDGAGQADNQTLEIAEVCDFIILPTGVTRDDLMPQIKLAHEFRRKGISKERIAISLSRVGGSIAEMEAATEFVNDAGYYCAGMIQERTSIGQCHDMGFAANETRYDSINKVIDQLVQNIGNMIDKEDNYGEVTETK